MLGDRPAAPIQRVRGTTDVLPPEDARLRRLESTLRDGFASFGYQGIETPILEPLELFLRKSGDEIIARITTALANETTAHGTRPADRRHRQPAVGTGG